jgi:hypothetical protein
MRRLVPGGGAVPLRCACHSFPFVPREERGSCCWRAAVA